MKRLRILQLCNKPPVPAVDGGCLAMLRMAEGLMDAGHEITILSIATSKHPWVPEKVDPEFLRRTKMDAVYVDTSVRWLPAFLSLFKTTSYNIDRFYNFGFEAKLIGILSRSEFDIVQLESLYMCPYIEAVRRMSKARIVLRAHNTESEIWKKNAAEETDTFKKLWFRDLAGKLEKYEQESLAKIDAVVTITKEDEARLQAIGAYGKPMHTATFAMKPPEIKVADVLPDTVFHIGAMDWKPNHDGVAWLVDEVWPRVLKEVPGAVLHLAGKSMNVDEYSGKQNVIAHGEVADAMQFMSEHGVMAIPLHSGGGVKVKMIEGMFAARAIVATKTGAEGISGKDGIDFFLAEDAASFAQRITELLRNRALAEKTGARARQTAIENHDLARVSGKLSDFYNSIL